MENWWIGWQMAKMKQTEMLKEAEKRRLVNRAEGNKKKPTVVHMIAGIIGVISVVIVIFLVIHFRREISIAAEHLEIGNTIWIYRLSPFFA